MGDEAAIKVMKITSKFPMHYAAFLLETLLSAWFTSNAIGKLCLVKDSCKDSTSACKRYLHYCNFVQAIAELVEWKFINWLIAY